MKRIFTVIAALFFPPRCAGCGKRLPPPVEKEGAAFCAECAKNWQSAMRVQCTQCFQPYSSCQCQPHEMKRAGVHALLKLAPYNAEKSHAVRATVSCLKTHALQRVFDALAVELAPGVLAALEKGECRAEQTVITHLPRTKRALRRAGFDQAAELARALSRQTGISYVAHLKKVRDTRPQKTLSAVERRRNLQGSFAVTGDVKGKCVILVDDVVTTGAGMGVCATLLRQHGADKVIGAAIALTEKTKTPNRENLGRGLHF